VTRYRTIVAETHHMSDSNTTLFPVESRRPLSVLRGEDNEALELLIPVHWRSSDPRILDATYNKGVMWKGTAYQPHRMDINAELTLDTVADFMAMPFVAGSFDVIVFDPPHLPTASASANSSGIERAQYGLTANGHGREGDNVAGMFEPFLLEAKRVLVDGGIVLAKIADITHNHRYQWQQVDFVNAVRRVGMTPCDLLVKWPGSGGNLKSSKWVNVYHLRRCHSYWIVVRNSTKCEARSV
jgi:hypothetical protein